MTGITMVGLNPTSIEVLGDNPWEELRTYRIGAFTLRCKVAYMSPHPWVEFKDRDGKSVRQGGFVGWSHHEDGDHIGSPYWAMSSIVYTLARAHKDSGGEVRADDPMKGEWPHDALWYLRDTPPDRITILDAEGHWVGGGTIDQFGGVECSAVLPEGVYEAIEEALMSGEIEGEGDGFSWTTE